ncbi:hypothetical protein GUJ93_ZPchr0005g15150 [Zizania palustris]|uniref:Uncharacterized protein n=1 Tax=Zizania palustris TaxID=103762 RepID=A0A8J5VHV9_ZIZPA|nr:hypothetical protein GUJ93_ZPchr0005g15150 [Zizania palustris]
MTMAPSTADFFDSCGFSNGHFSASRSTIGPSKMEPPSIQGTAFDPNSWCMHTRTSAMQPTNSVDACLQSTVLPANSYSVAPRNSYQSEEALHETHALNYMQFLLFFASSSVSSPVELQNCQLPSVAAETPVAGFNELIAPQYEHGDVSSHSDDFWSSAALFFNDFINLPDFQQDEFDMFMNTDMDTEAKPVSSGTGITTLPK